MVQKVTKKLNLDLSKVPRSKRREVRDEVGQFLIEAILDDVGSGKSPVSGEGKFKALSKKYKEFKASEAGNTSPNLELFGDMLDALEYKLDARGQVEVGIFADSGEQVDKADLHNMRSAKAKAYAKSFKRPFPKRQFIPDKNQGFKRNISNGIRDIIRDFEESED